MASAAVVRASNALAGRWARAVPPASAATSDTVFSPVGVWPLLAALAAGADGAAREELEQAVGLRTPDAMAGARDLLASLRRMAGVSAALGVWTRERLELEPGWALGLPEGTLGHLSGDPGIDQARLDAWAKESTEGRIEAMPVRADEDTLLVLVSALLARTRWLRRFRDTAMWVDHGPWANREIEALIRHTSLLDRAAVISGAHGPVTELRVLGSSGIDVHLLLGSPEDGPDTVIAAGLDALGRPGLRTTADRLAIGTPGPGLHVEYISSFRRDPGLTTTVVPFALTSDHDLLSHPEVFGLTSATDTGRGHFSGISLTEPLAVGAARQSTMTKFTALGFEAAAVSAISLIVAGAAAPVRRPTYRVRQVDLTIDRPHAFLSVHRTSRLVLAAGWVGTARDDVPDDDPWA